MLLVVEIIFRDIRIFRCHTDQFMMFQFFCCLFISTHTHPAFSESKIQDFMDFASLFDNCIFSDNSNVCCSVLYISRHIRSFCEKEFQSQFFIYKNQLSGILIFHFLACDSKTLQHLQCLLRKSSLCKGKC